MNSIDKCLLIVFVFVIKSEFDVAALLCPDERVDFGGDVLAIAVMPYDLLFEFLQRTQILAVDDYLLVDLIVVYVHWLV